jgi:NADP-dependent 3-hydroxy acid dehydrogenase YdfG
VAGIADKVVAITGASSGIGEATALLLAERGAKVVLAARGSDRLEALAARIGDTGGAAAHLRTDVSRREDVAALVELACDRYGALDVLVNNAGVMPVAPLDDLRVEEWDAMIDVNIKGVLYGIAAALPVFRKQGAGQFVNIASTAGHRTVPTQAVYSGTKFAVRAISEGLRQEAGDSIRVTIISPGMTSTNPEVRALLKVAMPAEAVARAIAFAIEQPADVDVNEVIVRPTAQA